jgi:hypothetical protein
VSKSLILALVSVGMSVASRLAPTVTRPLASTVTLVWVPAETPELARVTAISALAAPLKEEAVPVASPVREMSRAVWRAVAVAALPLMEPTMVSLKVLTPPMVWADVLSTNAPSPPRLMTDVPSPA